MLRRFRKSSRSKKLWARLKLATTFTGLQILVAEKHDALEKIAQLNGSSPGIVSQGNANFYTIENLKKRKALKHHPDVMKNILELWNLVVPDSSTPTISKDKFVTLMIRLHCLMSPSSGDFEFEKILALAEEDWIKDSGGLETMSKNKFVDSIFELIDIWTKSMTLDEYTSLGRQIVAGVSVLDQTGLTNRYVLKDVREIAYDPFFSEANGKEDMSNDPGDSDSRLCLGNDLVVLQAQRAMWEYDRLVKVYKQNRLKEKQMQETSALRQVLGDEIRESMLQMFARDDGKTWMIMKPKMVMKTVSKIYDAKIIHDTLIGNRSFYSDEDGGRFDRFVMLWHTQQFINKRRAIENLRLLLRSVRSLAWFHPRLRVFSKMIGISIKTPEGVDEIDHKFKPHAISQYLFPFLTYFLKMNPKTGRLERLEDWFGTDFSPKRVRKQDFLLAAERTLKYVPRDSPVYAEFSLELENICMDDSAWRNYTEGIGVTNNAVGKAFPNTEQAPQGSDPVETKVAKKAKGRARQKLEMTADVAVVLSSKKQNQNPASSASVVRTRITNQMQKSIATMESKGSTAIKHVIAFQSFHHNDRHPAKRNQEFVDVDRAVCLLLRVWDADYEWKQLITITSTIVLLKRCMRRYKNQKFEAELASSSVHPPKNIGRQKLRVAVDG